MLLDYYIAKYLLAKNVSVKKIKFCLSIFNVSVYTILYFSIYRKINKSVIGIIIFLCIIIILQIYRTKKLSSFFRETEI